MVRAISAPLNEAVVTNFAKEPTVFFGTPVCIKTSTGMILRRQPHPASSRIAFPPTIPHYTCNTLYAINM